MYWMLVLNKRKNKQILEIIFHLTKKKMMHWLALKIQPHGQLDTLLKTNDIFHVFVCFQILKINFNISIPVGMATTAPAL